MNVTSGRKGFTLIEVMISTFLTVIISLLVFQMYRASIQTFRAAERELRWLAAFRAATDSIERELGSIVWKAGFKPAAPEHSTGSTPPKFKPIDEGLFAIKFREDFIGFYTSLDSRHIDRIGYYHNEAEPRLLWNNGEDDDNDDPPDTGPGGDGGLNLLWDDRGSFMRKRTPDSDLSFANYDHTLPSDWVIPFGVADSSALFDDGDILADSIHDVLFSYVYITKVETPPGSGNLEVEPILRYAKSWPPQDSAGNLDTDHPANMLTRAPTHPDGPIPLPLLTLPLAVQVDFIFKHKGLEKRMTKMIFLYGSLWNKYLNDRETDLKTN